MDPGLVLGLFVACPATELVPPASQFFRAEVSAGQTTASELAGADPSLL